MPVAKRQPRPPTPAPDPDPGGQWERAIRALAKLHDTNPTHLVEEWAEQAAVLTYLGEMDVQAANARAHDLVRQRLEGRAK